MPKERRNTILGRRAGRPSKPRITTPDEFKEVIEKEGLEAYSRLVTEARSSKLKNVARKTYVDLNKWLVEMSHGKASVSLAGIAPTNIQFNFLSVGADGKKKIENSATYAIEGKPLELEELKEVDDDKDEADDN